MIKTTENLKELEHEPSFEGSRQETLKNQN
jgi:hypothetical protein